MNFEWDENKRRINFHKHGLDLAEAYRVFEGDVMDGVDARDDYGELRYVGVGLLGQRIVTVVFSVPVEDTIRIISLRKADSHERLKYGKYLQDQLGLH